MSKRVQDYMSKICRSTERQFRASRHLVDHKVADKHLVEWSVSTCRRRLISPRAAGVVNDLSLDDPLPLIIPSGTVAVMTAVALPIVADLALILDLSNAVLSPCSDTVRYLDQFKDVLLEEPSMSAV